MAAGGTAANVILGPGRLYMAPLGTTEPTSASATLPSANWIALGYTEDGTDLTIERTNDKIMVAEELYPVRVVNSETMVQLKTRLAEPTLANLNAALGGGSAGVNSASSLEIPVGLTGIMLVHDSEESPTSATNRRIVFREVYPAGSVAINFKKSPDKTLIDVTWDCVLPSGQTSPLIFLKLAGTSVVV